MDGAPFDPQAAPWQDRILRRRLLDTLQGLRDCRITIDEAGQKSMLGTPANAPDDTLHAHVRVHDSAFYRQLGLNGSVGAGEAYMDGLWDCDDLVALTRILVRNRDHLDAMETGLARFGGWAMRGWSALMRNTRRGSRRNIAAHYDLGDALFERMLDPTMTYSSAVFPAPDATLEEAQVEKMDRLCRRLALAPGQRVLEIGTGWGGFALHAAGRHGARVTTTTVSRAQYEGARARFARDPAGRRIELLLRDYRDLAGTYDRLVSIEMIEAVGDAFLDGYLRACSERLAPDGAMALQAIVIGDQGYEAARRHVDFIKQYVFPGGCLPSVERIARGVARATDLRFVALEDIGAHYAETLRRWRARFDAAEPELRELGFDDAFLRTWRYYLAYCEAGFEERHIGCVQIVLAKPGHRPPVPGLSTPLAG
ncbi:MAG: class I SAM-dependent methyltransferase [Myxococcales bacterium]|nr:class I SAM-dependent methyltransferase [Myxococcales bacterium]